MGLWSKSTIPGMPSWPGGNKPPGIDRLNKIIKKTKDEIQKIDIAKIKAPKIRIPRKK